MSKSSKYILAAGCSFTDSEYKSNQLPWFDTSYPKWPELLRNKINPDLGLINLGCSGGSNDYIFTILMKHILQDPDNIELIVAGWTTIDRAEFFVGGSEQHQHLTRINLSYASRTDDQILKEKYGYSPREMAHYFMYTQITWKRMIFSWLGNIYHLQLLADKFNIPLVHAQMINPTGGYEWANASTFFDNFIGLLQKFPNFYDIDPNRFMGWPVEQNLGGYWLDLFLPPEHRISRSMGDHHPNAEGMENIAQRYYEWYETWKNMF